MIRSKVRRLRFEKEEREGRKLTFRTLAEESGLSVGTVNRLLKGEVKDTISAPTLNALCRYFEVGVGEVLEYVPDEEFADKSGRPVEKVKAPHRFTRVRRAEE